MGWNGNHAWSHVRVQGRVCVHVCRRVCTCACLCVYVSACQRTRTADVSVESRAVTASGRVEEMMGRGSKCRERISLRYVCVHLGA